VNTRELGRWRKLWTRPSATWELLPLSARGLGDELIRYCDEQGRVSMPPNMQPHEVCARLLRAHHSEMRRVKTDLAALIADGFVVVEAGALVVRNFIEAQASVTESGHRMREKQERDASRVGASTPRADGSVPRVGAELPRVEQAAKPAESLEPARQADASEKREEEKREEAQNARATCPAVEPSGDAKPQEPTHALIAALGAGAGDALRLLTTAGPQLRFAALCHEAGITGAMLRTLGEYLRWHRGANPGAFPWRSSQGPQTSVGLEFFTWQDGERLAEFVGRALEWRKAQAENAKRDADQAAASRAAVEAMNRPTGLTREEQLAQVQMVRAEYAAFRAAQKARVANGSAA
jgi:hypothetical protein